jgi:hypothetical protein
MLQLGKLRRAPPSNLQLPTPRALDVVALADKAEAQLESVYADRQAGLRRKSALDS